MIEHSKFKNLEPISAGFCYVNSDNVECFGESSSLNLESKKEDSEIATNQLFNNLF